MTDQPVQQQQPSPSQSPFSTPISPAQRDANAAAKSAPAKQPTKFEFSQMSPEARFGLDQQALDRERGVGRVLVRDDRAMPVWQDELDADRANGGGDAPSAEPSSDDAPKFKVGDIEYRGAATA